MYLITGATGTVGRPLLAELDGHAVRPVTRDPSRLPGAVAEPDVTGVTAVFLHPRAVGLGAADLLVRAKAAGVRRVVVLSAVNVDDPLDEQPSRANGDRDTEVEAAAIGSGLEWVSAVAAAGMVEHGHRPEFVAALMARYERENGRPAHVSGDVENVLGRPARSFAEWVADHAEYVR